MGTVLVSRSVYRKREVYPLNKGNTGMSQMSKIKLEERIVTLCGKATIC
jgi:hypothetical protein